MNVRNPKYANAEKTLIDCEIEHAVYGWIPFTAAPDDIEVYGRTLFAHLASGVVGAYQPTEVSLDELNAQARAQRNALLAASDWTQLSDIPAATKTLWEPYRQALRDVTDQPGYPLNIVWPTPPTA